MADDTIRVGTQVDVSGIQQGMQRTEQQVRTSLAVVKEEFRIASVDVRQATARIVEAQEKANEAIAANNAGLAATYQTILQKETETLGGLVTRQAEAEASVKSLNRELLNQVLAASAAEPKLRLLASATEEVAAANSHAVSQMAATSGAIRVFEGALPIRAVENFATKTLGLGPIISRAFPVIGAIAFAEVVYHVGEEIWKVYDNTINLRQAQEGLKETAERVWSDIQQRIKETNTAIEEQIRLLHGASAADAFRLSVMGSEQFDLSKFIDQKKLKDVSDQARESITKVFSPTSANEVPKRLDDIRGRIAQLDTAIKAFNEGTWRNGEFATRSLTDVSVERNFLTKAQAEWEAISRENQEKRKAAQIKQQHDQEAETKQAVSRQTAAAREAERAILDGAQLQIDTLKVAGTDSAEAEKQIWLGIVDKVNQGGSAYRDVQKRIATLTQDQVAATAKAQEYLLKSTEQNNKAIEDEMHRHANESAKQMAQNLRQQQADFKEQQEISIANARAAMEQHQGALTMQYLQADRAIQLGPTSQSLNPFHADTRELEARRSLNAAILAEDQARIQREIEIAKQDPNNPQKVADLEAQALKAKNQADQRWYADTTQILVRQRAQYMSYFDTVNRGFTNALNGWIQGSESFSQAMRQMFAQLTMQLADFVANWILQKAEMWLMDQVLGRTASATAATAQIQTAAAVASANAFASTAAIPIIGLALAPAAAAAAYGEVSAMQGLAAFEKGGLVPRTGIAILHEGEDVIDRGLNRNLTNYINNNQNGGSRNSRITITNHFGSSNTSKSTVKDLNTAMRKSLRKANLA